MTLDRKVALGFLGLSALSVLLMLHGIHAGAHARALDVEGRG